MAQKLDGTIDRKGYDMTRARTALIWGGVLFAPAAHVWYNRVLNPFFPGSGTRAVAAKMMLDQTVWALPCNMAYLCVSNILAGKSVEQSTGIARNQIGEVMKSVRERMQRGGGSAACVKAVGVQCSGSLVLACFLPSLLPPVPSPPPAKGELVDLARSAGVEFQIHSSYFTSTSNQCSNPGVERIPSYQSERRNRGGREGEGGSRHNGRQEAGRSHRSAQENLRHSLFLRSLQFIISPSRTPPFSFCSTLVHRDLSPPYMQRWLF